MTERTAVKPDDRDIVAAERSRFRGAFMLCSVNHPDPLWRAEYARIREHAIAEARRTRIQAEAEFGSDTKQAVKP